MNLLERIEKNFNESISIKRASAASLPNSIALASQILTQCLLSGGKIIVCGNGNSTANVQHFTSKMLNRYEIDRPGLATISLNSDGSTVLSIADEINYDTIFSKQIQALGQFSDILLTLSTADENSSHIHYAIDAAHERDMHVVSLTAEYSENITSRLSANDIEVQVQSSSTPRIQEMHLLIINCLCDLIDHQLLGQ